jgi:N-acetyl-gamma-glutamyl-phosphate reductase
MNVAVVGASGYTGLELVKILEKHPEVKITALTSERFSGQPYGNVFPLLHTKNLPILENLKPEKIVKKADMIFSALPHKEAMDVVPFFIEEKKKVIDLSADFRFDKRATYEKWYQKHSAPALLQNAVYGLPEIYRDKIKSARLVANPGCYPTSIILPIAPLLKEKLISTTSIIADSKSGVTGAGRAAKTASLFCEVSESFKAYNIMNHRHQPEIEEKLSDITKKTISIIFSPHLIPINRGILSTIYVTLKRSASGKEIRTIFERYYKKEKFIRIVPEGNLPQTGWVRGSNFCDIGFSLNGKKLVLVSAIDNLVKGASGQAVQNMNIMMGFKEDTALEQVPMYP